ncbi:hypothetical protein Aduo_001038 [Ancylostoma duodenale]
MTSKGRFQVSKYGKRTVLNYRIPGTLTGYTFTHIRKNKSHDVYVCQACKKNRWNPIKVIGDEFRSDPCALPHVCTPQELELQRMREDPERFSGKTPYAVWDKLLWSAHSGEFDEEMGIDNEELRTDVEAGIHSADYQSRRLAISRRMNEITDDPVTLNNITASLAEFADGSRFLHEGPDEDLHIYYSEATLEHTFTKRGLPGPFKDLWCKFGIYVLRTTNTAEAYHRKLKEVFKCAHPPLATLIKALRRLDLQSRCKLLHKEKNPNAEKQLRAQDRRRRENVEQCMRRFNGRYHTRGATNAEIERYCKKMSRFISNKAI